MPPSGPERRAALRLSAIATTIYEQTSARYFEQRRPDGCAQAELLERYRLQIARPAQGFECGFHIAHQHPSTWSFDHIIRPFAEKW